MKDGCFCCHLTEWTLSNYQPYPYAASDGRNNLQADAMKAVRGGSWFDRPIHPGAAARLPYRPWQAVCNAGFRVLMSAGGQADITKHLPMALIVATTGVGKQAQAMRNPYLTHTIS